jgi:MFS family permease
MHLNARLQPLSAHSLRGFFFLLGLLSGTWMALIPALRLHWGLSLQSLGLVLVSIGVGSLAVYPLAHAGLPRLGSARMCALSGTALAASALVVAWAPQLWVLVLGLFALGASAGAMDSAINTQAVTQESRAGRSMMSGMHGFYSLGNLLAGAWVSVATAVGLGTGWTFAVLAIPGLALPWAMYRALLDDLQASTTGERGSGAFTWTRALVVLGVLIVSGYLLEGALLDWGGVYLRLHAGASLVQAPWAFIAFSMAMVLGRFMGDGVIHAWGTRVVLQRAAALVFSALCLALLWPHLAVVIVAFALAGLGLSVVVPVLFSLTGRLNPGDGGRSVAKVAMMGYAGILGGPALIGLVAERLGLPIALSLLGVLALALWRLGPRAAH